MLFTAVAFKEVYLFCFSVLFCAKWNNFQKVNEELPCVLCLSFILALNQHKTFFHLHRLRLLEEVFLTLSHLFLVLRKKNQTSAAVMRKTKATNMSESNLVNTESNLYLKFCTLN